MLEIKLSGLSTPITKEIFIFFNSSFKHLTDSIKKLALKESVFGNPKLFNLN